MRMIYSFVVMERDGQLPMEECECLQCFGWWLKTREALGSRTCWCFCSWIFCFFICKTAEFTVYSPDCSLRLIFSVLLLLTVLGITQEFFDNSCDCDGSFISAMKDPQKRIPAVHLLWWLWFTAEIWDLRSLRMKVALMASKIWFDPRSVEQASCSLIWRCVGVKWEWTVFMVSTQSIGTWIQPAYRTMRS